MHTSKIMSSFIIEDAHALVVVNTETGGGGGGRGSSPIKLHQRLMRSPG